MNPVEYRFIYTQEFWGETLQDSYTKTIYHPRELEETVRALYSDPHVKSVRYEKVEKIQ